MSGMKFSWPMQDPNLGLSQIGGIQIPQNYALTGNSNLGNIGMTAPSVGIGVNPTTGTGLQGPTTGFWGGSQTGGLNPTAAGSGLGFNLGTLNMGVNALAAVGGLYNAFQSNKLAKEQFAFTKEVTNTNLNNQIKTYNTTLEDRALARGRLNGDTDPAAYAAAYTDKNKISRG